MALESVRSPALWLAAAGVIAAAFLYLKRPDIPAALARRFPGLYALLDNKYYLDRINEIVFAGGARLLGRGLWRGGDVALIDGAAVNGSAHLVAALARWVRRVQTGFIYHYAFAMLAGVALVLFVFVTWPFLAAHAH